MYTNVFLLAFLHSFSFFNTSRKQFSRYTSKIEFWQLLSCAQYATKQHKMYNKLIETHF